MPDVPLVRQIGKKGRIIGWLTFEGDYKPGDPPPKGYNDWHAWAEVQEKAGLRQVQCSRCSKWNYPQEIARTEDREFVKFLLDQGADIDVIGNWDTATFPIEHAVFYGDLEILLLLIDRGADPTVVHGFLDENSRIRRGTLLDLAIYRLTSSGVFQQGEDRAVTQDRANRQEIVNVVRAIMQGGRLTKSARKREPERPLKRPRAEASLWVWRSVLRASKNDEKQAEQMLARTGLKKPTQ